MREKGKEPNALLAGLTSTDSSSTATEVTVALHPNKDVWSESDKVNVHFHVTNGGSSSSLVNNPCRDCSIASGIAALQQDDSYLLMVGSRGRSVSWPSSDEHDIALVLRLETSNKDP